MTNKTKIQDDDTKRMFMQLMENIDMQIQLFGEV